MKNSTRAWAIISVVLATACPDNAPPRAFPTDSGSAIADAQDMGGPAVDVRLDTELPTDARADAERDIGHDTGPRTPPTGAIASECPMATIEAGGPWSGVATLEAPRVVELEVGETSRAIFGRVARPGTEQPGPDPGFEAQLMIGPLGADPVAQPGCFRGIDAEFHADAAGADEYWTSIRPDQPGLYGMFYRYRPLDGAWLYGDLNGSDDGVSNREASVLAVDDPAGPAEIRVVTLNLQCRTNRWPERFDLVVEALVAADPHVIGFQEDCAPVDGEPQSYEIAARLADALDRGFEAFRLVTHQSTHPEGTFDEGIAMLSAFPIDAHFPLDLPFVPPVEQAQIADVRLGGGRLLRVINTHFSGLGLEERRTEAAALLVEGVAVHPTVVMGDLSFEPTAPGYATMSAAYEDAWLVGGVGDGFTFATPLPYQRIDYVWSTGLTVQNAAIVAGEDAGLHLSDHVGIAASFAP